MILGLQEQFRELVDRHYGSVWACVHVLTARSVDTEDLVHEAFLLAFDRLSKGIPFSGDPGQWLRGTARHLVFARWRRQRRLPEVLARHVEALTSEDAGPASDLFRKEMATILRACMKKLPDHDRELVTQRYEAGKTTARIAQSMALNPVTVRTRLLRVRRALRRCMETALGEEVQHGT